MIPFLQILLALSIAANIYLFTKYQKRDAVIRTAIRKAERDRCRMVRIPYNQLAELMGWEPEFKRYTNRRTGEEETCQTSMFPLKE